MVTHLTTAAEQRPPNQGLDELDLARTVLLAAGVELPSWAEVLNGAGPPIPPRRTEDEMADPGEWQHGWQYHASAALDKAEFDHLLQDLAGTSAGSNAQSSGKIRMHV